MEEEWLLLCFCLIEHTVVCVYKSLVVLGEWNELSENQRKLLLYTAIFGVKLFELRSTKVSLKGNSGSIFSVHKSAFPGKVSAGFEDMFFVSILYSAEMYNCVAAFSSLQTRSEWA